MSRYVLLAILCWFAASTILTLGLGYVLGQLSATRALHDAKAPKGGAR